MNAFLLALTLVALGRTPISDGIVVTGSESGKPVTGAVVNVVRGGVSRALGATNANGRLEWPHGACGAGATIRVEPNDRVHLPEEIDCQATAGRTGRLKLRTFMSLFDGDWVMDPAASPRLATAASHGGTPIELQVTHDLGTITFRRKAGDAARTEVFKVNGAESVNVVSVAGRSETQISTGEWDGRAYVVATTAAKDKPTTTRYSVERDVLKEEMIRAGGGQPSATVIYRRKPQQ